MSYLKDVAYQILRKSVERGVLSKAKKLKFSWENIGGVYNKFEAGQCENSIVLAKLQKYSQK